MWINEKNLSIQQQRKLNYLAKLAGTTGNEKEIEQVIKISIDNELCMPHKTHKWDAGWDLKSNNESFKLKPGAKVKVYTGVKIAVPPKFMGMVVPRSGLGSKFRVGLANTVGVIDSDYRGEIIVNLVNDGHTEVDIKKFDRFCQIVIVPVNVDSLRVVDELGGTVRGDGGFGSTDIEEPYNSQIAEKVEDQAELEEILEWTEENPNIEPGLNLDELEQFSKEFNNDM